MPSPPSGLSAPTGAGSWILAGEGSPAISPATHAQSARRISETGYRGSVWAMRSAGDTRPWSVSLSIGACTLEGRCERFDPHGPDPYTMKGVRKLATDATAHDYYSTDRSVRALVQVITGSGR